MKIPSNLPPLPEPPAGHKWVYLGKGVVNEDEGVFLMKSLTMPLWIEVDCCGGLSTDYAEAVPIETEPDYSSKSHKLSVMWAAWEGTPCQRLLGGVWLNSSPQELCAAIENGRKVRIKPPESTPDPYAELKAARAAGKVIQLRLNEDDEWSDADPDPRLPFEWSWGVENYRIKPDPITVPLEAADLPPVCWLRKRDWHFDVIINGVDKSDLGISIGNNGRIYSFKELMEDGVEYSPDRKTWKPCCKEVEE